MNAGKTSAGRGVTRHDPQISTPGGTERSGCVQGPEARGGESGVPAGQQKTNLPGSARLGSGSPGRLRATNAPAGVSRQRAVVHAAAAHSGLASPARGDRLPLALLFWIAGKTAWKVYSRYSRDRVIRDVLGVLQSRGYREYTRNARWEWVPAK